MKSNRIVVAFAFAWAMTLISAQSGFCEETASNIPWPANLPVYDHIVIVVEENKDYDDIIENPMVKADYIRNVLKKEGASFTRMFGEEHNSQGNYFWMFSGSNQAVGFQDIVPNKQNHPDYPFESSNLGSQLIKKGRSFKGYSEGLRAIGDSSESAAHGLYARKHVPWISFSNVPNENTVESSSNLRFSDFPTDFSKLPTVAFVIPNLVNDMHNGTFPGNIQTGDQWLKQNLDSYYQWAKTHNSLLIVTFDENDDKHKLQGLTDPAIVPKDENDEDGIDRQNRIATIFAGAQIKPGEYAEGAGITHINILRTIEAMYSLPRSGAQQTNAAAAGITDDKIITDVFVPIK